MEKRTYIELAVTESGLSNVPVPRRVLVDVTHIASIEDLGDNPHANCFVTLHEASDTTVEDESGEHVVRSAKTLMVLETYDDIRRQLEAAANVVRSQRPESIFAEAIERARRNRNRD